MNYNQVQFTTRQILKLSFIFFSGVIINACSSIPTPNVNVSSTTPKSFLLPNNWQTVVESYSESSSEKPSKKILTNKDAKTNLGTVANKINFKVQENEIENIKWWQSFNSQLLNSLIEKSENDSFDVKVALNKIRQARTNVTVANSRYFPTLSGSIRGSRSAKGESGLATANNNYSAGLDARWEIPLFNGQAEAVNAVEAEYLSSLVNLEDVKTSLYAEIAAEYINLRSAQMRINVTKNNINSQAQTLEIITWKEKAGLVNILNVEQAQADLAGAKAILPDLQNSINSSINRLSILLGITSQEFHQKFNEALANDINIPEIPLNISLSLPIKVLPYRPDVRAAELSWIAAANRAREKQFAHIPTLAVGGSFDWQSLSLSALGGASTLVKSIFANLALSIFEGGAKSAQAESQEIAAETAFIQYEKTYLNAIEEVENNLYNLQQNLVKAEQLKIARDKLKSVTEITHYQYDIGTYDFQKILTSNQNQLNADNSYEVAKAGVALAMIKLYKSLAGRVDISANLNSSN